MAGDWIKMRGALISSPKLIRFARELHSERAFRDWLTPGGGATGNGQIVSDHALRAVALALLNVTWSASREHGKFVGEDLLLSGLSLSDVDGMSGVPGVGKALASVGWALESSEPLGVILPNFKQHNVPMTAAERMRESRNRCADVAQGAQHSRNKRATREEKRRVREDKGATPPNPPCTGDPPIQEGKPNSLNGTPTGARAGQPEKIRAVFAHYRTHHPKAHPKAGSESKEWKRIAARLAEGYTVEQLCAAIDGMHRSPFHLGENERGREYLTLELAMRDSSHVTKFLEIPLQAPVLSEKTRRTMRAAKDFVEDETLWGDGGLLSDRE